MRYSVFDRCATDSDGGERTGTSTVALTAARARSMEKMGQQDRATCADTGGGFRNQSIVSVRVAAVDGIACPLNQHASQCGVAAARQFHVGKLLLHRRNGILESYQHDDFATDIQRTVKHSLIRF